MNKKIFIAILAIVFIFISIPKALESETVHRESINTQLDIKPEIQPELINKPVIKEENNSYIIMEATAYDLSVQCCGKSYNHPSRGITRDGYNLNNKSHNEALTVSSNKFPMGTKLQLEFPESHKKYNGIYTVRDTGNFKKNVLDVFVGDFGEKVSKKAINFGRVNVKVYVIK